MTTLESIAKIVTGVDFDYAINTVLKAKKCFVLEHSNQDLALTENTLFKVFYGDNNTISKEPIFGNCLNDILDCLNGVSFIADCFIIAVLFLTIMKMRIYF